MCSVSAYCAVATAAAARTPRICPRYSHALFANCALLSGNRIGSRIGSIPAKSAIITGGKNSLCGWVASSDSAPPSLMLGVIALYTLRHVIPARLHFGASVVTYFFRNFLRRGHVRLGRLAGNSRLHTGCRNIRLTVDIFPCVRIGREAGSWCLRHYLLLQLKFLFI